MDRDTQFTAYAATASRDLLRLGYLLTGDPELAKDVAQEALIKMYVAWPRIRDKGRLHAYARTTMIRQLLDWRRRHQLGTEIPVGDHPDHPAPSAAVEFEASEALLEAIRSLAPKERTAIVLRFYEDLTEREAADVMGCTLSSVKSATHRGMDKLRRRYLAPEDQLRPEGVEQ